VRLAPPKPEDISENDHQKRCVEYARKAGFGHLLIMVPNGTQLAGTPSQRARYMASLKAMGLMPGAADLFLAKPVTLHHGAWFEMKRIGARKASQGQIEFLSNMQIQGYYVDVCHGFDEWLESYNRYVAGLPSLWMWPV
jgi:hypothetical protein